MKTLGVALDQFRLIDFIEQSIASIKRQASDSAGILQMGRDGKSSMVVEGTTDLHQHLQDGKGLFFQFRGPYGYLLQKSGDTLFVNAALHTGGDCLIPPAPIEITENCEALEEPMRAYLDQFLM